MTRLVLFQLFVTNLLLFEHNKKLLVSWQFSGTYGVIKYGSGWRKDIVNQCLEFGLWRVGVVILRKTVSGVVWHGYDVLVLWYYGRPVSGVVWHSYDMLVLWYYGRPISGVVWHGHDVVFGCFVLRCCFSQKNSFRNGVTWLWRGFDCFVLQFCCCCFVLFVVFTEDQFQELFDMVMTCCCCFTEDQFQKWCDMVMTCCCCVTEAWLNEPVQQQPLR